MPDLRSDHRELQLLEMIADDTRQITQRTIASRLGIALGLSNLYVKRLVRKGYIKCVSVQPNRIRYLITPKGISEKARLTYAFISYSLDLYGQARSHLREALRESGTSPQSRVAIFGTGEAAELTYLTLREQGIEPVAIFAAGGAATFLGSAVTSPVDHARVEYDVIIVATLDPPHEIVRQLLALGVERKRLLFLRTDVTIDAVTSTRGGGAR